MSTSLAELLERVVDADRAVARAVADRARALAAVEAAAVAAAGSDSDDVAAAVRSAHAELALRLGLTSRSVATRTGAAVALVGRPAVLAALDTGAVGETHAHVLVAETDHVDSDLAAAVTATVLVVESERVAAGQARRTPAQLGAAVRNELGRRDADGRQERALADREVRLRPLPDGMAQVTAVLPAAGAVAVVSALRSLAAPAGAGDARSLGQRMADALVEVFTGGAGGFRPQVQVLVPVASLTGAAGEPGLLVGYGPLDATACRRLAAVGELRRVLVDGSGRVLAVEDRASRPRRGTAGTTRRSPDELADVLRGMLRSGAPPPEPPAGEARYRPSRRLRRLVETRDLSCRFPGCSCPATAADLDHVRPWSRGGATSARNLAALCATHHRLKHSPGWQLALDPDGTATWTTPTGMRLRSPAPTHAAVTVRADQVVAVPVPGLPADADLTWRAAHDDAELDALLRAVTAADSLGSLSDEPPFAPAASAAASARDSAEALAWEAELRAEHDPAHLVAGLAVLDQDPDEGGRPHRLATDADEWPSDADPVCTDWDLLAETNGLLAHRMAVEAAKRDRHISELIAA